MAPLVNTNNTANTTNASPKAKMMGKHETGFWVFDFGCSMGVVPFTPAAGTKPKSKI